MDTSRRNLLLGSAGISLAPVPGLFAGSRSERGAAFEAVARSILGADPIPGLSVAVIKNDQARFSAAYGMADLELGVSATPAHRYRLGSVSKVITASLAARLSMKGAVDLHRPIGAYLPDLPSQHRDTTLIQLLTHKGGVRHYGRADFDPGGPGGLIDSRTYPTIAEALDLFIRDPLVAAPGTTSTYSTFGYTLASAVLQGAMGRPFLELIREEISGPLGLNSLGADNPFAIESRRVSGYELADRLARASPGLTGPVANAQYANPAYKWAGGGLIAEMMDIARFGAAHLTPGHWDEPSLRLLFTPNAEPTGNGPPLGLGWRIDNDQRGRLRWHHAGTQAGCRAVLVVYPLERLSIAFATNLTAAPSDVLGPAAQFADAAES